MCVSVLWNFGKPQKAARRFFFFFLISPRLLVLCICLKHAENFCTLCVSLGHFWSLSTFQFHSTFQLWGRERETIQASTLRGAKGKEKEKKKKKKKESTRQRKQSFFLTRLLLPREKERKKSNAGLKSQVHLYKSENSLHTVLLQPFLHTLHTHTHSHTHTNSNTRTLIDTFLQTCIQHWNSLSSSWFVRFLSSSWNSHNICSSDWVWREGRKNAACESCVLGTGPHWK